MIGKALLIASAMVLATDARDHRAAMLVNLDDFEIVNLQGLNDLMNLKSKKREKNQCNCNCSESGGCCCACGNDNKVAAKCNKK